MTRSSVLTRTGPAIRGVEARLRFGARNRAKPQARFDASAGWVGSALLCLVAWLGAGGAVGAVAAAGAAEIATNGVGGGAWTDPATWRGKKVPGPDDDAVILKNDVVTFDRTDDGKLTCRKLQIDPKGGLTFKTGGGKLVLAVAEGIESFGAIRLDGTRSAGDDFELRLLGDDPARRLVKLGKGGALLLYGRADLPNGRHNVAVTAPPGKEPLPGLVEAQGGMIDWQRADVRDVKLLAKDVDNTGARPNQRIKVARCRFTAGGRVACQTCDSPEVVKNTFDNAGKRIEEPAISIYMTPLAEVKENTVHGGFLTGIAINYSGDPVVIGNAIAKCGTGIQGGYGVPNAMIKKAVIVGCEVGVKLEGASGVLEDVTVDGATTALHEQNSNLQLTQFRSRNLAKKGVAVLLDSGTLSLLDCPLRPEDFKVAPQAPAAGKPPPVPVTCLQPVVVAVPGAPAGTVVEVRTAKPAPAAGAADPNVRNSPAPLIDGRTPLPATQTPLTVKAWSFDAAGKLVPGPEYTVRVLGPSPKEGAGRPVLATRTLRPAPTDPTPTLEVLVK